LEGKEGAFFICSFWLVEALVQTGRCKEAADLYEQLLARKGDHGLFAEELDPSNGEHLGNVPQAFSHVGLINAALSLGAID
jgi:GH15 family glucan-1,4-alpha-glucosidase